MVDSNDRAVSLITVVDHVFRSAGLCAERRDLTEPRLSNSSQPWLSSGRYRRPGREGALLPPEPPERPRPPELPPCRPPGRRFDFDPGLLESPASNDARRSPEPSGLAGRLAINAM